MMRACAQCSWAGLPIRDVCPRCRGMQWSPVNNPRGAIVQITRVHRAFGETFTPARLMALVRLDSGGFVVARASEGMVPGGVVTIDQSMQAASVE